jgi:nucleoside-diphosphate-sugar epimerase
MIYGLDRKGEFSEQVLSADISNYEQTAQVVKQFHPLDAIIHLAGDPRVDASWESILNTNIIGTRNIFEAAREFQVPRVVFASSNHVTGAYHGFELDLYKYAQPVAHDF